MKAVRFHEYGSPDVLQFEDVAQPAPATAQLRIHRREEATGGPRIAQQILVMPMLDDRTITPDPHITPNALWSYDVARRAIADRIRVLKAL